MIVAGQAKQTAKFFAPDGCTYARSTSVEDILQSPYFRLRVDDSIEYHCVSSIQMQETFAHMSASQRTVYLYCLQNGVADLQARNLALMFSQVLKKISE